MTQQVKDLQLAQTKKPSGPSSPNAAKRLYRNLSGKFRVNYTSFDEGSLAARNEKERLRKSCLVCHLGILMLMQEGCFMNGKLEGVNGIYIHFHTTIDR